MFVWICKASLPPNQALKVSKSQLLASADGLTALLVCLLHMSRTTQDAQRWVVLLSVSGWIMGRRSDLCKTRMLK